MIHIIYLLDQIERVGISTWFGDKFRVKLQGVTAQGKNIIYFEEIQINERIFSILPVKATTNEVWNGIYIISMHYGSTDTHRSWSFSYGRFLVITRILLFIDIFLPMICYINKRGLKLHQRI